MSEHETITARLRALETTLEVLRERPRPLPVTERERHLVETRIERLERALSTMDRKHS